jgi:hypothetical protein
MAVALRRVLPRSTWRSKRRQPLTNKRQTVVPHRTVQYNLLESLRNGFEVVRFSVLREDKKPEKMYSRISVTSCMDQFYTYFYKIAGFCCLISLVITGQVGDSTSTCYWAKIWQWICWW